MNLENYKKVKNLLKAVNYAKKTEIFPLNICPAQSKGFNGLLQHQETILDEKVFLCNECDQVVSVIRKFSNPYKIRA